MNINTVCFEKPGKRNTDETLEVVKKNADVLGIQTILVASNTGETALEALRCLPGKKIIAVTHHAGFREENHQEMTPESRAEIEKLGGHVLTCQHALGGISRAIRSANP